MSTQIELAPETVDAIAQRVAEILRLDLPAGDRPRWVDAATLARELGVTRAYVYAHKHELGGQTLPSARKTTGKPRPRWRFDLVKALEAHAAMDPDATDSHARSARRRRRTTPLSDTDLLPDDPIRPRR